MTFRLGDEDTAALRQQAAADGIGVEEAAVRAVRAYARVRPVSVTEALARVVSEDAELLERLSR